MEAGHCPPPTSPSPTSSAASKGKPKVSPANEEKTNIQAVADDGKVVFHPQQKSEKVTTARDTDVSEASHGSTSVKEPTSQGRGQLVKGKMPQKLVPTKAGNQN